MKLSDIRTSRGASISSIWTCLLIIALCVGCKPEETATSSPKPTVEAAPEQPEFSSAIPTSFDAVTAQLDPGGNVYAFVGTRQWMEGISGKVEEWRSVILELQPDSPEDQQLINNVFDLVTNLIDRSGVEEIAGAGISGIAIEPDLYRTKLFVHRNGDSEPGGIWTMFGKEPHEFPELDFLPAETVWATWSDFNLAGVWSGLESTIGSSGIPELEKGFGQISGVVQAMTGKPLSELIGSLDGSVGAFITFNEDQMVSLPIDGTTFEMPEPGIVLGFKVKDDTLFDLLNGFVASNPDLIVRDEDELRMRILPVQLPVPLAVRVSIARFDDYLFLASNDRLIDDLLAVQKSDKPGLKSTAEFARLSEGVPTRGNSFNFISTRLMTTIQDLQTKSMAANSGMAGNSDAADFLSKIQSISESPSAFTVAQSTSDGWLTVSHGTQEPATAIVVPLVVVPTAVLAGLTLPALSKAKDKAAQISCVNNMKQLELGVRIYANDNLGKFPETPKNMGEELQLTRASFCPLAPNFDERNSITWEELTVDEMSYEYSGKGLTEESPADTVIWRCHYHGNVGYADGSVLPQQ